MTKQKMSQEELRAEALRLDGLIQKRSKAVSQAVAEMSKRPLSLQQMRRQTKQIAQKMAQGWSHTPTPTITAVY